ncbi:hypothetical protein BDQ17DRAFT_1504115 [Cyathus striatus]|nr:hypothetical protein BDQ17DRAFT_1504115 [Cyathus striatus]
MMVLQSNFAKRMAENLENSPSPVTKKSLVAKFRTSITDATRRRRARTSGSRNPKYVVEQAKRRSITKSPANSINFRIRTSANLSSPTRDVEMQDAEPLASTSSDNDSSRTMKLVDLKVARELSRPEFREVASEALAAVRADLAKTPPEFVRDSIQEFGPRKLLQALSGSKPSAPVTNALPKELAMTVQDLAMAPTHMMAVHGGRRPSESQGKSKVTLFAVHSIILAAHCTKLPPFPPSPITSLSEQKDASGPSEIKIPVRSLCLPCPEQYANLVSFLYTKRTSILLNSLLPCPIPPNFEEDQVNQLRPFARKVGDTFALPLLLTRMRQVFGLWQNVCALGIFDDELWDTMDLAWDIYLHALAASTKQYDIVDGSSESQPQPPSSTITSS